jgi:predicted pyridoxine 5'-phosphate oxidase superfamily flavin-nucleotide-binding protein
MLDDAVKDYIKRSVLCWLATVDPSGRPNVSPKEAFAAHGDSHLVIANIASPQSVRNLRHNPNACLSFVDVFVQKGFKLRGRAEIIGTRDPAFVDLPRSLVAITKGAFPIHNIIFVKIDEVESILAPSYRMVPGTAEASQVRSSLDAYGVQRRHDF